MKNMVLIQKPKSIKIAKGYRLKPATHKLIDKLQIILNADQDKVISDACKLLYKELRINSNKIQKRHNSGESNSEKEIIIEKFI
jgi:hypothetical protein